MPPVSQVTDIRTLQEFDDEAATLRASLEEAERRLRGSEELEQARAAFDALDAELNDIRRTQRALDGDISVLNSRIQPEEKRLYDGSVRNPKELGNIQHELELLKDQRSKLEDQLLEVMSRLETVEASHSAARAQLARAEQQREVELEQLHLEARRLGDALVRIDAMREAQKLKIAPQALHVYESIRRRHGSMAVAHIQGGMCAGCRVTIPEAIRRRAFH